MSAKIYAPPTEVGDGPQFDPAQSPQEYFDACEQYIKQVGQWALDWNLRLDPSNPQHKLDSSGCVGEELRFHVGDGHASYIVLSMRPVRLIELKIGDGWQFQFAHILTAAEIKKIVTRDKKLKPLFHKA